MKDFNQNELKLFRVTNLFCCDPMNFVFEVVTWECSLINLEKLYRIVV